jgi:hypothetical protein
MIDIDDKELISQLEKAALSERLRNQEEWKLLQEAANRIVDRAVTQFAKMTLNADTIYEAMELQIIIRKYKHGLFKEVDLLAQEGERLFEEAKDRDLLEQ